ncbi:hypothetical protein [Pseudoalteromonas denitrificans]|uniref:Uncharacterized protein n=1 Tax=Pseudoalteromonas denitrificans DSM 6059 TaxID=1123010 RepID=A0A1I1R6B2_9GAMM|nr:hypothetical protein [Pseudoalteromonas denitrificans]SFD27083.1 hypothetical protein SAMN02745724_04050 [Pseudoalteromonas denitrificans DSM 6059]
MKLSLNKKKIKNLSKDTKSLPADMTPQVGGGRFSDGERLSMCYAYTCGSGGRTCKDVY